uniref:Transposase n=1 Tax=Mesocestoides corti TaxID=53468 RepID=A0A5K3ELG5_MESCO
MCSSCDCGFHNFRTRLFGRSSFVRLSNLGLRFENGTVTSDNSSHLLRHRLKHTGQTVLLLTHLHLRETRI